MREYMIREESHGFTVREDSRVGLMGRTWAYSTLPEVLDGLKELMKETGHTSLDLHKEQA